MYQQYVFKQTANGQAIIDPNFLFLVHQLQALPMPSYNTEECASCLLYVDAPLPKIYLNKVLQSSIRIKRSKVEQLLINLITDYNPNELSYLIEPEDFAEVTENVADKWYRFQPQIEVVMWVFNHLIQIRMDKLRNTPSLVANPDQELYEITITSSELRKLVEVAKRNESTEVDLIQVNGLLLELVRMFRGPKELFAELVERLAVLNLHAERRGETRPPALR
jgi:hypothetical protein